MFKRTDTYLDT